MDGEKVKAFLTHLSFNAYEYKQSDDTVCGYDYLEVERIADDALTLLKEQEAVKIHITDDFGSIKFGHCPNCGATINSKAFQKSCGCGQAVKWE